MILFLSKMNSQIWSMFIYTRVRSDVPTKWYIVPLVVFLPTKTCSDFNNLGLVDRYVMRYWDISSVCVNKVLSPAFFLVDFLPTDTSTSGIYNGISNSYKGGYCGG